MQPANILAVKTALPRVPGRQPAICSGSPIDYCVGLSVRAALMWHDEGLAGLFKHADGSDLAPAEARLRLQEELLQGHEIIPFGTCDNWDAKDGCQGHSARQKSA